MYLLYAGITYKETPIYLREKLSFPQSELTAANQQLGQQKSILENVIVSTCNRTEIYAVVDQLHTGRYYIKQFLAEYFQLPVEKLSEYLCYYEEGEVVRHCFCVASGLDSMLIGETQILGQVKQGFAAAQAAGTTGTIFNYLFRETISFAKRMHTHYGINNHSVSLSHFALQQADAMAGGLTGKTLFILGAGEMGQLVLKHSTSFQLGSLQLFNRTLHHAEAVAADSKLPVKAVNLSAFYAQAAEADVIISTLRVAQPFLAKQLLQAALKQRSATQVIIDLGLPRTVDPHCQLIEQVQLCDLDKLNRCIQENQQKRSAATVFIHQEIAKEVLSFQQWERQLGIVPVIRSLRKKTMEAEEAAMDSLMKKIPTLSDREYKVIRKHMKSIVNQTLRTPIKEMKELSIQENAVYDIQLVQRLFGIDVVNERNE